MKRKRTSLRDARLKRKLTQHDVARSLGVEVRSYQRYESGERTPSIRMCFQLENLLGVSLKELLSQDTTEVKKAQ